MSYVWFQSVLAALGKRINFDSISCLYGNSFAKDAAKIIQAANPLVKNGGQVNTGVMGLMGQIKIIKSSDKEVTKKAAQKQLGGGSLDWAEGLF